MSCETGYSLSQTIADDGTETGPLNSCERCSDECATCDMLGCTSCSNENYFLAHEEKEHMITGARCLGLFILV